MPQATNPLPSTQRRRVRAARRLGVAVLYVAWWCGMVAGVLYAISVSRILYAQYDLALADRLAATVAQAREHKLQELCGGQNAAQQTLADGGIQCYDKRGRKTTRIRKDRND